MNSSHASKSIQWQTERSAKLQRACRCINAAKLRGEHVCKAIRRISRRYHGRPYKSQPSRRLALAPATLRALWDKWKNGGERPWAFQLKYRTRCPFMPAPLLVRFANFCASNRLPSVRVAWANFSNRPQNGRAKEFSYQQVIYAFDSADFYLMQSQLKSIVKAQSKLDQARSNAITAITSRLAERPPRRRANLANAFEI